jgi:hypothetical protein
MIRYDVFAFSAQLVNLLTSQAFSFTEREERIRGRIKAIKLCLYARLLTVESHNFMLNLLL